MYRYLVLKLLFGFVTFFPICILAQPDDLGDSASFGKEARFFGSVSSGAVYLHQNCLPPDIVSLGPNDRCKIITNNSIIYDYPDIGRITFPANTFQNVIYPVVRNTNYHFLYNTTASNRNGSFAYRPTITFESEVLLDTSLINPLTGQPFNGKVNISLPSKTIMTTLVPSGMLMSNETYTTNYTNGLTKKYFMDAYGLSQTVVDNIFQKKITIRLNVKGNASTINDGYVTYTLRFFGN